MAKYLVKGKVVLLCEVTVEAENEDEAIKKAYDTDKLVGIRNTYEAEGSIFADGDIEYDEAEVIEE